AAQPSLSAPGGSLVVLDPESAPRFPVYTVNYRTLGVRLYAVSPTDWAPFKTALQEFWRGNKPPALPGRLVSSATIRTTARPDEVTETSVDLTPALRRGLGHVVISVEPGELAPGVSQDAGRRRDDRVLAWVQSTRIGLDAFSDTERLVAWATSLDDGRPLEGVEVSLGPGGATQLTGRDGVTALTLTGTAGSVLVARRADDIAILPENTSPWGQDEGWQRVPRADTLRWCIVDDRHLYRPGEVVRVKGWVRVLGGGSDGDLRGLGGAARQVSYRVADSRGNEIDRGTRELSAFGSFDLTVNLPATMNLGTASVSLGANSAIAEGRSHRHTFQVQEFRRPEFEVTTAASEGPHLVGSHATAAVSAAYFAGGSLTGADVTWRVTSSPSSFTPPNRSDYIFGTWIPWWEAGSLRDGGITAQPFSGVTDESGKHRLRIDFDRVTPPRPMTVRAEATVMDVNRQAWSSGVNLLVHPASLYVGLRRSRLFVQRGEPIRVDTIVTDLDGHAVAGRPVRVRAERREWVQEAGEWKESAVDTQECAIRSEETASPCAFKTAEGGTYRVSATVTDEQRRSNESEVRIWVAGGKTPPRRNVEQEVVTLVPDKESCRPGDETEILVVAPFTPAEGLLTLRRSGIIRTERFVISGASHTLRFRVEEAWTPNVHVQVDLVGAATRADDEGVPNAALPRRPAFASGSLDLSIPPIQRTLTVKADPRADALEPGGATVIDVSLHDSAGKPVAGGEVAVIVVDEAVLSLTSYRIRNPLDQFYTRRSEGTRDFHSRGHVILGTQRVPGITGGGSGAGLSRAVGGVAESLVVTARAPMGQAQDASSDAVRVRSDFNALALFAPGVRTDANGRAEVPITVPDNLTRYRIVAVAATEGVQFGIGESTLTARLPLMVRASPPRFLNFGDRAELPVVVQNQTGESLSVDVAIQATNAGLPDGRGRQVTVPANNRVEVRFPVAAERAGIA
ncbi:MAG: hypothetical protein IMZ67_02955, partial [Acidobacteria bacterium]|nr:hypothetical protein [Acidobacteriota bacterium]